MRSCKQKKKRKKGIKKKKKEITKEKEITNNKKKKKEITKRKRNNKKKKKRNNFCYFTLDSVKHSLHVFYFGMRFTLAMQWLQEFNLFQIIKKFI